MFQTKLTNKKLYKTNISRIKLRLVKLQKSDKKAQKFKVLAELIED